MSRLPKIEGAVRARWFLLVSVLLNVCFVGAASTVALRYSSAAPLSAVARIDRNATDRLDHMAATLPLSDAQVMRAQLRADAIRVASAQADFRLSQEEVRNALRAEPFDVAALRAAEEHVQAARGNYHLVLHRVIEAAVTRMSTTGRNKVADWSAVRENASATQ